MQIKETKEKISFWAQYFGQKVFNHKEYENEVRNLNSIHFDVTYKYVNEDYYLLLKDLKDITDEEILFFAHKYLGMHSYLDKSYIEEKSIKNGIIHFRISNVMFPYNNERYLPIKELSGFWFDYFRSLGYLMSFKQYSCDEIIQKGWAKIRDAK